MITGNDASDPDSIGAGDLGAEWRTFVHELSSRGYRNHLIGKYGVDNHNRSYDAVDGRWRPQIEPKTTNPEHHSLGPLSRGFDTFYGLYGSVHNHFSKVSDYRGHLDWHCFNESHIIEAPELDPEAAVSSTHIFTRETIRRMREHLDGPSVSTPFFIYLSFTAPHDPLLVDAKYIGDEYPQCRDKGHHRRKLYCGMVSSVDEGIGNITAFMKDHGLMENTIIIFSSDNGGFPLVGGFNYPFRGQKGSLHDGGMRTPSFISAPFYFTETSRTVYDGLIHLVDWGPTLLSMVDEMSGVAKGHSMGDIDGMDLNEVLSTKDFASGAVRGDVILDANGWTNSTAFIAGDWKLVLGFNGGELMWMEPVNEWTKYPVDNSGAKIPDVWNWFIQKAFGPDYWFYEWSFVAVISRFRDSLSRVPRCTSPINRHPDGWAKGFRDSRPLWMPVTLEWDNLCKVRLYNLREDISESNNLALDHPEIVAEMVSALNERLKVEEGRMDLMSGLQFGIYRAFRQIAVGVVTTALITTLGLCLVASYCCKCCRCGVFKSNRLKTKTD